MGEKRRRETANQIRNFLKRRQAGESKQGDKRVRRIRQRTPRGKTKSSNSRTAELNIDLRRS